MSLKGLLESTNSGTKLKVLTFFLFIFSSAVTNADSFEKMIKSAAVKNGLVPTESLRVESDDDLFAIGEKLFESKHLSNSQVIACADCHLEEFGSSDGLPNSVGIGGIGKGAQRLYGGGEIIPRNSLALWGRGQKGFDVLFWDGRVQKKDGVLITQFGDALPSQDPLVVAVHLPAVEIREMLIETPVVSESKNETVLGARDVFSSLMQNLISHEPVLISELANVYGKDVSDLEFLDAAKSIAHFIRVNFQLKPTKFHEFVFSDGKLSQDELDGARLFYGKGKCAVCHSGTYFSDFDFHTVPFPQIGFGKNGFGIDYGRYNASHDASDLYKFRTPPLINVDETFPYGHSGSVATLKEAVVYHFDPLRYLDLSKMNSHDRTEYYKRLSSADESMLLTSSLSDSEVEDIIAFLKTLSFSGKN